MKKAKDGWQKLKEMIHRFISGLLMPIPLSGKLSRQPIGSF